MLQGLVKYGSVFIRRRKTSQVDGFLLVVPHNAIYATVQQFGINGAIGAIKLLTDKRHSATVW